MRALIVLSIALISLPVFASSDRDGDGITDANDKCPDEPEDKDGFQDADGCPDSDNDADGITDANDKCPMEPEDKDGFQDADGCPDPDNDQDGIVDAQDRCPNEPETMNGFEDADGCPDAKPNGGKSPSEAAREGTLNINASPWADVTIDGKVFGRTPLRNVKLTAGKHAVVLTNGSKTQTRTVEIRAGKAETLVLKLD